MTKEDFKVEVIYLWEKHKESIYDFLGFITLPIWLPIFILCLPFMVVHYDNLNDDIEWCKQNNKEYPWGYGDYKAHKIVKAWKKELRDKEVAKKKESIRRRIRLISELNKE